MFVNYFWKTIGFIVHLGCKILQKIRFIICQIPVGTGSWISLRARIKSNGGGRITIGRHCEIHPYSMILTYGGDITIGNHCSLNPFSIIYGIGDVRIGNGVRIASHVTIVPGNHIRGSDQLPLRQSGINMKGINIEDNVWIGSGARILDGVRIGRNSIVGAGSVVTRSVPANSTVVGVPARETPSPSPDHLRDQ